MSGVPTAPSMCPELTAAAQCRVKSWLGYPPAVRLEPLNLSVPQLGIIKTLGSYGYGP